MFTTTSSLVPPNVTGDQEAVLRSFSDSLSCNERYRQDAETLIHKIREYFERRFSAKKSRYEFSIDSTFYAGSFDKRTDVLAPDADVTFRMNGSNPPAEKFGKIIEVFKSLLMRSTHLALINGTVSSTAYTVQFLMNNGIEVDLVPATTMTANQIYEAMAKDPKNARYYRSSLIEYQVGFMKSQTAFAHAVARLGKLFLKTMYLGADNFSAGSTIMELIGVAAAMEIEGSGSQSIFRALWRVLDMIQDIKNIRLAFKIVGKSGNNNKQQNSNKDIWAVDKVPRMKGRYIIEPSDPSDNLLANKTDAVLTKFNTFANIMKQRLGQWGRGEITLRRLFDPYPMNIQSQLQSGTLPNKIYISYTTFNRTLNVKVWNKLILMDPAKKKVFDILKQRVLCLAACLKHHSSFSPITVKGEVIQLVKETFPGVNVFGEGPGQAPRLRTFDVTISYLVEDGRMYGQNGKAVRASVIWN